MLMRELKPAPAEAIDLLERIERLQHAYDDLRSELNLVLDEVQKLKEYRAANELPANRDHRRLHATQIQLNVDFENRLIGLEDLIAPAVEPQPKQKNHGDILRMLLSANNGKMLHTDARTKMGLTESQFSQLLSTMKDTVESKPLSTNRRKRLLVLKKTL